MAVKKNEETANTTVQTAETEIPIDPVPEAPAPTTTEMKPDGCAAGFYCYIGPSIRGLIRNGTVYRGTRAAALTAAAAAIEKQPLVKALIVSGDDLPAARLNVKKSGNALNAIYERIAGKQ